MSLDAAESVFCGFGDELLLKLLARQAEGDVHEGAAVLVRMSLVEAVGAVNRIVEKRRLLLVALRHFGEAALRLDPCGDLADHVDAESGRRVVEGVLLVVRRVAKHCGERLGALFEQRLLRDDEAGSGGAEVLLHACVDEAEFLEVEGTREHVGRHVGKERNFARLGNVVILRAVDRVVVTQMKIRCIRIEFDFFLRRHMAEAAVLRGSCNLTDAEECGLFVSLRREAARQHIAALLLLRRIVHRDHGESEARAALHEEHVVVVAESHEREDVRLRLVVHLVIRLGTVRNLEDRHARVVEIEKLRLRFLEHIKRQSGRAGIEIVNAIRFHRKTS